MLAPKWGWNSSTVSCCTGFVLYHPVLRFYNSSFSFAVELLIEVKDKFKYSSSIKAYISRKLPKTKADSV